MNHDLCNYLNCTLQLYNRQFTFTDNRDYEYFKNLLEYEQQNYHELKEECLRKGVLFEDDLFEASPSSYLLPKEQRSLAKKNDPRMNIEWLRPSQIVSGTNEPRFIQTSKSYATIKNNKEPSNAPLTIGDYRNQFNFVRGRWGCSNFISALPILFRNHDAFAKVVPEDQSFDSGNYAGEFERDGFVIIIFNQIIFR